MTKKAFYFFRIWPEIDWQSYWQFQFCVALRNCFRRCTIFVIPFALSGWKRNSDPSILVFIVAFKKIQTFIFRCRSFLVSQFFQIIFANSRTKRLLWQLMNSFPQISSLCWFPGFLTTFTQFFIVWSDFVSSFDSFSWHLMN